MSLAIGPIVRLRTRALYGIINQRLFGQIGLLSLLKPGMSLIFGSITLFSLMGVLFGSLLV